MIFCTHCFAELPEQALFCGDCGRAAVASRAPSARKKEIPFRASSGDWLRKLRGGAIAAPVYRASKIDAGELLEKCEQCDAPLAQSEIFCSECGYVSRSASRPTLRSPSSISPWPEPDSLISPTVEASTTEVGHSASGEPAATAVAAPSAGASAVVSPSTVAPVFYSQQVINPAAEEFDDIEATRIVPCRDTDGQRYVLQFSTGESVTVFGTGLVGRNPRAEPGEVFDTTVGVIDPTRSVSKTHLEFGQTGGRFWVNDRFSGNGSIVREPDAAPTRCTPGRRQLVARGSRIDIGDQFFVVS